MTEIVTKRLRLRPAQVSDAEALHGAFSDPEAMRYWSTLPHTSLDQTKDFVQDMIDTSPDEGIEFVVEHQGRVIGKAGIWQFPEIGFILRRDTWGKGLGTEAVRAVLDHSFGTLGLDRVIADVDPQNAASLRMMQKLGFRETGRDTKTLQIGEAWADSVYFEVSATEWAGPV